MTSYLNYYVAKAHADDLLRQAKEARAPAQRPAGRRPSIAAVTHRAVTRVRRSTPPRRQPGHSADREVTIRFATPADDPALRRLAQLDSSSVPRPPVLIAEQDGETRAALSVLSSHTITDPFHSTAALVELLRTRAVRVGMDSEARSCEPIARRRPTTPSGRRPARTGGETLADVTAGAAAASQ